MSRATISFYAVMLVAALGWAPAQDRDPVGDAAVEFFRKYLSIDTTNPPGDVSAAAEYLRQTLDGAGRPLTMEEYRTIHGHDERIREDSFRAAARIYYEVVKEFCRAR